MIGTGHGRRTLISVAWATAVLGAGLARSQPAPEPGAEPTNEVVISATRAPRPIRDVPTSITVLPQSEIARSPSETLDELLRIIPSFGTFRRSSSLGADPSAQGVNLRGIGPSGVSRTLVLLDGVPANDAFGGWFYWRSVPRLGIDRVEVAPGGGSALYGNYALGGVVQIVSRPLEKTELDADGAIGLPRQASVAVRRAERLGSVGLALEGEAFSTSGYEVVAASQRGPIDADAPSDHQAVRASVEWRALDGLTLVSRAGYFAEYQNGGTRFTTSSVSSGSYLLGAGSGAASWGALEATFFGHIQTFKQNRARINADRTVEALAASQRIPEDDQGFSLIWKSPELAWAGIHRVTSGIELRRIYGAPGEDAFPVDVLSSPIHRESRAEQRLAGAFVEDSYRPAQAVELIGALRFDAWNNLHAHQRQGDSSTEQIDFPDRSDRQLSPKLGVRVRPLQWLTLRASAYGAFRAPTLNELYRPFQVGTILTAPNSELEPETLRGAEAGFELNPTAASTFRANGFWNELRNPIANVTLPVPLPDGSQRQRQNAGTARIRGVELDALWRLSRVWSAGASYAFVDSAVLDFPGNPQLVGRQLAQDPPHRATLSIAFDDRRLLTATIQGRFVGPQFEDDQNLLALPGFFVIDVFASRRLFGVFDVYLAIENLLNRTYLVGRAGVDTIGPPFTVRLGLRARSGR